MNKSHAARRARQARRSRAAAASGSGTIRLVVCGVIFVVLVVVKLLFPGAISGFAQSAGQLIGRNADFKEAFAAIGRAISGEEAAGESLQDAYAAVFNPASQEEVVEPVSTAAVAPLEDAPAIPESQGDGSPAEAGQDSAEQAPEEQSPEEQAAPSEDPDPAPEEGGEAAPQEAGPEDSPEEATTEAMAYVYTMPAPPDNASLEQRNLAFPHQSPILGVLTSSFGWREHPVEGGNKFHYGVDLAAAEGEDIYAFADGIVYATGESSALGNYIMLQHQDGYITLYAHCSRVAALSGSVSMGDKIAEVGSTGMATGPHLHFELHDGSLYLNPIFYVELG